MKPSYIAAIIVRLFAISLFVYASGLIPFVFSVNQYQESLTPLVLSLLMILGVLFGAIFLWKFPLSIARKITNISGEIDEPSSSMSSDEFASICFFALGLYLLYGVIGELIYWMKFLNDPLVQQMQQELPPEQTANIWALGVRAALVIFLLVGNGNLIKLARWLRRAG